MINRDDSALIAQERRNLASGKTHTKPAESVASLARQTVARATNAQALPPLRAESTHKR